MRTASKWRDEAAAEVRTSQIKKTFLGQCDITLPVYFLTVFGRSLAYPTVAIPFGVLENAR